MTKHRRPARRLHSAGIATVVAVGLLAFGSSVLAASPTTVLLGTAGSYAVLAGTPAISNTGPTTITGDVGIDPAVAVDGFPPGLIDGTIHAGDAEALQAKSDLGLAYDDAAGRPVTSVIAGGALGGQVLVGGVYNAGGVTLDLTGTLTLDAENDPNAVWIFQATSDLVTASSSTVTFINGGNPCNVFWQVTSSATLGSGSTFIGTILALTSITVASGATIDGRLLARNGEVTLIDDTITRPTCAAALPTSGPSTGPSTAPTVPPTSALAPEAAASNGPGPIFLVMAFLVGFFLLASHRRAVATRGR